MEYVLVIFVSTILQYVSCIGMYVQVNQGVLAGAVSKTVTGEYFYSYKGIPYAKPPIGKLRFKAPQPPEAWFGIRDATEHGPTCPQVTLTNELIPGSEDCLYLNIYTPFIIYPYLRPVIVSFPGGAYKFGSGNEDIYGPDFLVTKGLIVVTVNYRLDALGFLDMGTCEVPGNAGLKDQVAALKWVQENIMYFGGDPKQVTIIGESAAAASLTYHMITPASKGLFRRAIVMGGTFVCDWNTSFKPVRRAFILGKTLGLETKNKTELLNFLQSVPYLKLINTTCEVMASEEKTNVLFKMIPFPPVVERECPKDSFLTSDPMELLKFGDVNKVDVMFGYNTQESLLGLPLFEQYLLKRYNRYPEMFVPSRILSSSTPEQILRLADKIIKHYFDDKTVSLKNMPEFINYGNSINFIYGTHKFFRNWPAVGRRYFYKFGSYSKRNFYGLKGAPYGIIGASHFDDVFYVYDPKSLNMPFKKNSIEYKMIQQLTTAIANFVIYGNPTPNYSLGVIWPQFNTSSFPYMEFTDKMTVRYKPDQEDYEFWDEIYKDAKV